jgi:hypothetical protein
MKIITIQGLAKDLQVTALVSDFGTVQGPVHVYDNETRLA